ncbi:MAG: hypothetical protein GOVbin1434_10 [Prokaryotic dsDNA virus sp.]|nr:MAG: hypothetical protein GOVbin1434_10 [Prokaryotic dsDNA virus sp.]|tara:strand:+ start:2527 stop:3831 length:1305 start_codon:yes stop_codon:yes gene_type:complete
MINMTVEEIIKNSVKEAKQYNQKMRRNWVRRMLDYYGGNNTEQYIDEYFNSSAFKEIPCYNANFTRRFINKMSRIYTVGATRNVNTQYDELTIKKDARMKHVERMTRLIGTVATQVIYKEVNGMPYFDYRPVYYFDVHLADPFTPTAIMYPLLMQPEDGSYTEKLEYAYWDESIYAQYDENGEIVEEYEHGYGILPFVFTHREEQIDEFFVDGANDIVDCNEQVNIAMTEMQLGLRFQMFGQPYMTGVDSDKRIERAGSDQIIDLPEGATFDIVSPAGNIQSVIENIKFQVDLVAQNNHLYVQFAQDGGETPSGIALKIKDLERFEDYQDDLELWRMYEHMFYHVEKEIAAYNNINLPEKLKLDFKEPEYPKTVQDQIMLDEHRLKHFMIDRADLLMEYNNDLSRSEAEAIISSNQEQVNPQEEVVQVEDNNNQ